LHIDSNLFSTFDLEPILQNIFSIRKAELLLNSKLFVYLLWPSSHWKHVWIVRVGTKSWYAWNISWGIQFFQVKEGKISLGITVPCRMREEMKKEINNNFSPWLRFELRTSHSAVLSSIVEAFTIPLLSFQQEMGRCQLTFLNVRWRMQCS